MNLGMVQNDKTLVDSFVGDFTAKFSREKSICTILISKGEKKIKTLEEVKSTQLRFLYKLCKFQPHRTLPFHNNHVVDNIREI